MGYCRCSAGRCPVVRTWGNDLHCTCNIPLADALTGGKLDVEALDGNILRVNLKETVHPGYKKVVKGKGMPSSKQPQERGDLVISFNIEFPKTPLSTEQKEMISNALPRL